MTTALTVKAQLHIWVEWSKTLEYVHVVRFLCFTVSVLCVGFVKNKLKQENFNENIYGRHILVSNKNERFFFLICSRNIELHITNSGQEKIEPSNKF